MPRRLTQKLTYANVMSTIAVFGVLAGGGAYAGSMIGANDIAPDAVRGKHIQNGAVSGADVDESKLGPVPAAVIGGLGRSQQGADPCDPTGTTFITCASVSLKLPRPARVLLMAEAFGRDVGGYGGACRFAATSGAYNDTTTPFTQNPTQGERLSLVTITGEFPPGEHSFRLDCNQHPDTDASTVYRNPRITVIAISAR